jgi:8-oxo-dGTP pyrophosphatase MutT (NUDIX family)
MGSMKSHREAFAGQVPISLDGRPGAAARTQFAALCYRMRRSGKPEVLLITSRETRRWIIPKGWPMDGRTPAGCAEREAWEEAGVVGRSDGRCIGTFSYGKLTPERRVLPCTAMVFAVAVERLEEDYPEAGQRERLWLTRGKAAKRVAEPELARLLRAFDPA